jgi:copper chaperone CopZ
MQINLRKANAIQAEIKKAISGVKVETSVSVDEFTPDFKTVVATAQESLVKAIARKRQLNKALFEIRNQVGEANSKVGINEVLTEVQLIDADLSIVNPLVNATIGKEFAEIEARLEKAKASPQADSLRASMYGINKVETSVVTPTLIEDAKLLAKSFKRDKQELQDKLLQLNVNTLICLSAETVTLLKEEGIL